MKLLISLSMLILLSASIIKADQSSLIIEKIRAGALVVDVRTPEEFAEGHYKGAINIPLSEIHIRISEFGDKTKPVIVYCRSGNRSEEAKKILKSKGFTDVTNAGGVTDMPKSIFSVN